MSDETSVFECKGCGCNTVAVSHTWKVQIAYEDVGFVNAYGKVVFDGEKELGREQVADEWIAYCSGCGAGVTVEWLDEAGVKRLLGSVESE